MNTSSIKNRGLKLLPHDARDYSHAQVFGSIALNSLPTEDFIVAIPLEFKNQDINYPSDFCAAYGAAEAAEAEDQIIMVPEYTFAAAKFLLQQAGDANALQEYGLNLRDIAQAGIKIGFLPRIYDPFKCNSPSRPPREFIANFTNWPEELAAIAAKYKRASYFSALKGPYDAFDNVRAALWLNRKLRIPIETGLMWRQSWTNCPGGIIPTTYESNGGGHAFNFIGQKTINGEIYLVMQSSDGPTDGDNGYYYFNRQVVNKEIPPFGAILFRSMTPQIAAQLAQSGASVHDSIGIRILRFISNIKIYI